MVGARQGAAHRREVLDDLGGGDDLAREDRDLALEDAHAAHEAAEQDGEEADVRHQGREARPAALVGDEPAALAGVDSVAVGLEGPRQVLDGLRGQEHLVLVVALLGGERHLGRLAQAHLEPGDDDRLGRDPQVQEEQGQQGEEPAGVIDVVGPDGAQHGLGAVAHLEGVDGGDVPLRHDGADDGGQGDRKNQDDAQLHRSPELDERGPEGLGGRCGGLVGRRGCRRHGDP
ncbi:hypothetical protein D3C86_1386280 [compost metagenome]